MHQDDKLNDINLINNKLNNIIFLKIEKNEIIEKINKIKNKNDYYLILYTNIFWKDELNNIPFCILKEKYFTFKIKTTPISY